MSERLAINKIRTDGGTQPRAGLDDATVADYAESVKAKAKFPPIVVYHDGAAYWLADGFHRLAAHRAAQKQRITADVRQGTLRDAILHSVGANATHGLRRSNEDKRRAVQCLLDDPEWSEWSDRAIAKKCNVSNTFVSKLRGVTVNVDSKNRKYTTKHGTEATMNTAAIGKDRLVTAVSNYLRDHYQTEDPALLASHGRNLARSKGDQHFLYQYLSKNGYGHPPENMVKTAVIEAAQAFQEQVPLPDLPEIAAGLRGEGLTAVAQAVYLTSLISEMPDWLKRSISSRLKVVREKTIVDESLQFWSILEELLS